MLANKHGKSLHQLNAAELKELQDNTKKEIRTARREIEKQIFGAERAVRETERDLEKKIKEEAAKEILRMYAKHALNAQKTRNQVLQARARVQSLEAETMHMFAQVKLGSLMSESAALSTSVGKMSSIPQIASSMQNIQHALEKHGVLAEMLDDAFEAIDEVQDLEGEADKLVEAMTQNIKEKSAATNNKPQTNPGQNYKIRETS